MISRLLYILFIGAYIGLISSSVTANDGSDDAFASANRDFEAGNYTEAAAKYLALAQAGNISSDLYFNLGTAKYRLGEVGESILWMRRALVVEPSMPEVRQNLTFLRSKLAFFEFAGSRLEKWIARLPATFSKWTVSIALWIGLIALSLVFFEQRLRARRSALITLTVVALLTAFIAARTGKYRATQIAIENFATIILPESKALTAPTPDAKSVIDLPPGSEVRILRDTGQWCYAEIPGDLRGWIRAESLEAVWPLSFSQIKP